MKKEDVINFLRGKIDLKSGEVKDVDIKNSNSFVIVEFDFNTFIESKSIFDIQIVYVNAVGTKLRTLFSIKNDAIRRG